MAPYKKYAKKGFRNLKKVAKKRYAPKGKLSIVRVAQDVARIQRSLNVEHKHIDFAFGATTNNGQRPTKDAPVILAIPTPARGTSYNQRVGNQIRIVHMTAKLEFVFQNNTDLVSRTTCKAQILFAKNSDDVPQIDQLYDLDPNGHYTTLSMANTQEWNKFRWIKPLNTLMKNTNYTNRYPASGPNGATPNPAVSLHAPDYMDVKDPATQPLNIVAKYSNKQTKCSVKMMFKNNSDEVEQMKPYLLLRSDVIDADPLFYDPVVVSGTIRMTYVDN